MSRRIEDFHKEIVGKTLEEANCIATEKGYIIREQIRDMVPLFLTTEYNPFRINVETRKGKILASNMTLG